jgi:hypothetical protein
MASAFIFYAPSLFSNPDQSNDFEPTRKETSARLHSGLLIALNAAAVTADPSDDIEPSSIQPNTILE